MLTSVVFIVIVAGSSWADESHSAIRDPLSYFGSRGAPAPTLFAMSLGALGAALVWVGFRRFRRPVGIGLLIAGVCAVVISMLPLDCSPVDDVCEVVIRAGADSVSHDLHGYVAFLLHLVVVLTAAGAARSRPFGTSRLAITGVLVLFVASIFPVVLVLTRPFGAGLGVAQIIGFAAAGALAIRAESQNLKMPSPEHSVHEV